MKKPSTLAQITAHEVDGDLFSRLGMNEDYPCRYCGAPMFWSEGVRPFIEPGYICLNGCHLPHGLMVKMQQGLREAYQRVRQEGSKES